MGTNWWPHTGSIMRGFAVFLSAWTRYCTNSRGADDLRGHGDYVRLCCGMTTTPAMLCPVFSDILISDVCMYLNVCTKHFAGAIGAVKSYIKCETSVTCICLCTLGKLLKCCWFTRLLLLWEIFIISRLVKLFCFIYYSSYPLMICAELNECSWILYIIQPHRGLLIIPVCLMAHWFWNKLHQNLLCSLKPLGRLSFYQIYHYRPRKLDCWTNLYENP